MQHHIVTFCVTFDLGSAKIFSAATFETYFSYHKTILITSKLMVSYTISSGFGVQASLMLYFNSSISHGVQCIFPGYF